MQHRRSIAPVPGNLPPSPRGGDFHFPRGAENFGRPPPLNFALGHCRQSRKRTFIFLGFLLVFALAPPAAVNDFGFVAARQWLVGIGRSRRVSPGFVVSAGGFVGEGCPAELQLMGAEI